MSNDIACIYQAGSLAEAQLFSNRLDGHGIESFIQNDESPLDGLTAGEQTIGVCVRHEEEARAREVLAEFLDERA